MTNYYDKNLKGQSFPAFFYSSVVHSNAINIWIRTGIFDLVLNLALPNNKFFRFFLNNLIRNVSVIEFLKTGLKVHELKMTSRPLLRRRPTSSTVFRQIYDDRLKEKYEELCELIQKTPGLPCVENDLYEKAKKAMKMYERTQKGYLPNPLPFSQADRIGKKPYCWHEDHADFGVQVEGIIVIFYIQ